MFQVVSNCFLNFATQNSPILSKNEKIFCPGGNHPLTPYPMTLTADHLVGKGVLATFFNQNDRKG